MRLIDVEELMQQLAARRPIFHSEADFQHEFAWQIRIAAPALSVRLERPFPGRTSGAIDLLLRDGNSHYAIELKYLTRSCEFEVDGEGFKLKQHGAQDVRRYDVCKDIQRMEEFCCRPSSSASVIVLTNDPYYWRSRERTGTCAEAFDIVEGRDLNGQLHWAEHTGIGTKRNREAALEIRNSYRLSWKDYSDLNWLGGRFRYLHIPISSEATATN